MNVTSKSTKAEILQAYQALRAQPTTWADAWALAVTTAAAVQREAVAIVKDCYNLGAWARRMYDQVVAELSRPLLKS